jgi:hypothetical protein
MQCCEFSEGGTVRCFAISNEQLVDQISRQMNMDYALCQALETTNIGGIPRVITYYDINCMFSKYFQHRVERTPFLHVADHIQITPGISLLHITEHKPECSPRHAPTFIPGAGLVAGEIIESLWSGRIGCTSSTRTASAANRAETLDDHMNDNNWSKLVNIGELKPTEGSGHAHQPPVETVSKRYVQVAVGLPQHAKDFEERSLGTGSDNVKNWSRQAETAELKWKSEVEAMDIYLATKQKGEYVVWTLTPY